MMSASLGVGGALGLPIAALIAEYADWHVLFWASAVLGALAACLVVVLVPESTVRTGGTFDFGDLLRKIEYTQKDHPETAQFEDDTMKTALQILRDKLRAEEENTRKFRNQLMRLMFEDQRDELLARIEKADA